MGFKGWLWPLVSTVVPIACSYATWANLGWSTSAGWQVGFAGMVPGLLVAALLWLGEPLVEKGWNRFWGPAAGNAASGVKAQRLCELFLSSEFREEVTDQLYWHMRDERLEARAKGDSVAAWAAVFRYHVRLVIALTVALSGLIAAPLRAILGIKKVF